MYVYIPLVPLKVEFDSVFHTLKTDRRTHTLTSIYMACILVHTKFSNKLTLFIYLFSTLPPPSLHIKCVMNDGHTRTLKFIAHRKKGFHILVKTKYRNKYTLTEIIILLLLLPYFNFTKRSQCCSIVAISFDCIFMHLVADRRPTD